MTTAPAFARAFSSPITGGETLTTEFQGFTITATIHDDPDAGKPWENEDGHGPVSDWRPFRSKRAGEMVLCRDGDAARFYDFAEACRISLRDQWGASAYRLDIEHGANGLKRANAQFFEGRELQVFESSWCDDINDAIRQVHAAHRDTFPTARAYAARAARDDFARLKAWCENDWLYVGVAVTVAKAGVELVGPYDVASWGIESDAADHLTETANELTGEALDLARAKLADLAA